MNRDQKALRDWNRTFDAMQDAVCLLDREGRILHSNEAMLRLTGQDASSLRGRICREVLCGSPRPFTACPFLRTMVTGRRETLQMRVFDRWFEATTDPLRGEDGALIGAVHILRDVTEQWHAESDRRRIAELYATLSQANQAIARSRCEEELFPATVRVCVESGHFVLAWIGEADHGAAGTIRFLAAHGPALGYLEGLSLSVDPDRPDGRGPAGTCLREGRAVIVQDWDVDPLVARWRERGGAFGIRSSAAFPLQEGGRTRLTLNLYSRIPEVFTPERLELLEGMAVDLSFALDAFTSERLRQRAEQEALSLNAQLEARVQERTTQLQSANQELEAFAYSISHDLKAPLRAVAGFSQATLEDYAPLLPAEGQDMLRRVQNEALRMSLLIDDLLRLSRLGQQAMSCEDVDLTSAAEAILRRFAHQEPDRALRWEVDPGLAVYGDPILLRVLLENLLGNAWKFTVRADDARIRLNAGPPEPGWLTFVVSDNGVGFNPDYASRLFTPFRRLHTPEEFPGTGIGLAIVHRITSRHGGWVRATGGVGKGATFTLGFPNPKAS